MADKSAKSQIGWDESLPSLSCMILERPVFVWNLRVYLDIYDTNVDPSTWTECVVQMDIKSHSAACTGGEVPVHTQSRRSRSREPSVRLVRGSDTNLLAAAQAAAEAVRAPSPAASNVTEVSELRRVVGVRVEPKLRVSHGSGSSVRVSALCLAGGTVRCCRAS